MIEILNKSFYKNGYLLIIAAWLYTISFIFSNYWVYSSSPSKIANQFESYIEQNEKAFNDFTNDHLTFKRLVNRHTVNSNNLPYLTNDIGLFVYMPDAQGNLRLQYWSSNRMMPEKKDLEKIDGKYYTVHQNNSFEFIKKTFFVNGSKVVATALIPLYWNYFFENQYLQSEFAALPGIDKKYDITTGAADIYIKNQEGKALFGLVKKKRVQAEANDPGGVSIALRVLAVIFVLIFINVYAFDIVQTGGWRKALLFLASTVFILRLLSYYTGFPFQFRNLKLFDPVIYASNFLHPSLGDLLINSILFFWLVGFVKFSAMKLFRRSKKITGNRGLWVTLCLCIVLLVLAFTGAGVIRSLISDSQISFDVTNFFSLNIFSLISFVILCFIALTFYHASHLVLLFINKCADVPLYFRYVFTASAGLVYLSANINSQAASINVIVLVWLLLYMYIMEHRKEDLFVPMLRSSFFLIWLIFFAASITALIIYQNNRVKIEQSKKDAEKLSDEADHSAENLMSIGITDINSEFLTANLNRLFTEGTNKKIKDSLINEYFSGYLSRYDTRLFTYDANRRPLFNEDSIPYEAVASRISGRSKTTLNPDMYFYENEFNGYNLLYKKEMLDTTGRRAGYFFVVAEPKKYKNQSVSPELFKQVKDVANDLEVTYAIYNRGRLVNAYGDYNFPTVIPREKLLRQEYREERKDNYTELWYNAGNNKMIILVKTQSIFFESITLFAYLFATFLFIVVLFQAGVVLIKMRFRFRNLKTNLHFSIRNQIQGTIIFISIFSFLVIGVSTISFYINRFGQTNREKLVKAIKVLANEIEAQVATYQGNTPYALESNDAKLKKSLREISEIHAVDANMYNLSGSLTVSTQPYIFNKQILSKMMEPNAYFRLRYAGDRQVIQNETVSHFSFLSVYAIVRNQKGQPFAYLNIPYLNTQRELKQEISNFLVTLINLNAFIFVIAGAISVLLANRITKSFTLIASKMQEVNLGKANEEIVWTAKDEIGALVKEYNKMVNKLEESAQALAKSEREGAWREMARQVAHEIKNPLTPMKLSIQYLQRAIHDNSPNVHELSEKVSSTLIEQIDKLAKIASDFSQFANIGHATIEQFNINHVLESLLNLYSTNPRLSIQFNHNNYPAIIKADRLQINRLFTNLIQNAIEASEGREKIEIVINETIKNNKLQISVVDRGQGIAPEKREKIFTPNFTTKTSGTGLGLAISKSITENANGKIWFDTEEGVGTTFHVLLPLVNMPV